MRNEEFCVCVALFMLLGYTTKVSRAVILYRLHGFLISLKFILYQPSYTTVMIVIT